MPGQNTYKLCEHSSRLETMEFLIYASISVHRIICCWPLWGLSLEFVLPRPSTRRAGCRGDLWNTGSVLPAINPVGLSWKLSILNLRTVYGDSVRYGRRLWRKPAIPVFATAARLRATPLMSVCESGSQAIMRRCSATMLSANRQHLGARNGGKLLRIVAEGATAGNL
jgi:hypothetical protein